MRIICFLIFFFITAWSEPGLSQLGTPVIFNHKKSDYKGSTVNWEIRSTSDGYIYAANAGGLLEYDGKQWSIYGMPNQSIVRSLFVDNDKIYVGGQDEVGYFERTDNGYDFHSLRDKIDQSHLPLEDVWDITVKDGFIYFLSKDRIYIITEKSSKVVFTGNPTYALTSNDEGVYFADFNDGIYRLDGFERQIYISKQSLGTYDVLNLSGCHQKLMIGTADSEILVSDRREKFYELKTDVIDYLKLNKIQDIAYNSSIYAIGTRFGGIVVLNRDGTLRHIINKKTGLQNDAINRIELDKYGNIWTASANGIDNILVNGKKQTFYPDGDLQGSIFTIVEHKDNMYYATSNGLYFNSLKNRGIEKMDFQFVKGSQGQVWGLDILDGKLFMAHDAGAFEVEGNQAKKISPGIGAWKFIIAPDKLHLYVGTYFGVDLYQKKGDTWKFAKTYKYPQESCRILVAGKGNNLWISHPYRGLYRMIIDENFDLVSSDPYFGEKGLPSNKLNYIFDINGKMIVAAERGLYEYDVLKDEFVESTWLNSIIPDDINIRHLQSDSKGNIWYVSANEVARLNLKDGGGVQKKSFPELVNKFVGGFESMYLHNDETIFVCSDQGVIRYNISEVEEGPRLHSKILRVSNTDSTYNSVSKDLKDLRFSYNNNSITLSYTSDWPRPDIQFSYLLKGSDKHWSNWTSQQTREYTNLASGSYTFQVKAMSPEGITSEQADLTFNISPPWYRSTLAFTFYSLFILLAISGLLLIPNKKYQKAKALLEDEKLQTKNELEKLKVDKLHNEIAHQNSALASSTMHLVQKNSTLNKVKLDIENIRKTIKDTEIRKQLKKVLSSLNDDTRLEEDWESFAMHFDKVHSDFLQRLKVEYSNLSPKDMKLAAYLRMNLNTKEIAPLLNISVRGVEISRYRLRKKLELPTEVNLSDWMLRF